ncbi:Uncharacterized protein TCM_034396 [Theobroma cacao]|uniref:Uncharacterized protein n=1 Tax=Theobroma cacao TaxID=3641 RepID=A0A061FF05_THECC|nr:Uncharacterized protein TCM_034396 [Theobroma cacao]
MQSGRSCFLMEIWEIKAYLCLSKFMIPAPGISVELSKKKKIIMLWKTKFYLSVSQVRILKLSLEFPTGP